MIWARWASAAVLVVLLTTGIGFGVHYLKELGRNELRPKVAELESLLAAEKNARERAETAANAYWTELGNLSRRPVSTAPVRLCVGPMPSLSQPPQVLMVPPPAPGAMTDRLEAILKQGQTSAPNSTASPKPVTPK